MIIIVALSLSLLVVLAALALLAKTKKEDLPKGYVFASYATLSLGILMFLGSIMGGIIRSCQHRGYDSCYSSHHGAKCSQFSDCKKASSCSSHKGIHHGQHGAYESSCTKGGHHANCDGKFKMHKRMHVKKGGISKDIEIKMEFDDDDDGEDDEDDE